MIITFYARFEVDDAIARLRGIDDIADLLTPTITGEVSALRWDPARSRQLIMLRMSPDDAETWDRILSPLEEDFGREIAAADRLLLLLAGLSTPVREASVYPGYVEPLLRAVGWSQEAIEIVLRGTPLYRLLERTCPQLVGILPALSSWLVGGWQDRALATDSVNRLDRDAQAMREAIPDLAITLSRQTSLATDLLRPHREHAVIELRAAMTIPEPGEVIWIVQD